MIIPKENSVVTSKGLKIDLEIIPNNGGVLRKNEKWVYHSINAYISSGDEKVKVGYLNIAYIDEEKKKEYCDNLLMYAAKMHSEYLLRPLQDKDFKDITKEDLDKMFENNYHPFTRLKDHKKNIKTLEKVIDYQHGKAYKNFLEYHYLKPEPDYIDVKEDYRQKGIGMELYKKAAEFLGLNGLSLYQSTTQTNEAKASWKSIESKLDNIKVHTFLNSKAETKERKYIDWTHLQPKVEIKNSERRKIKPS